MQDRIEHCLNQQLHHQNQELTSILSLLNLVSFFLHAYKKLKHLPYHHEVSDDSYAILILDLRIPVRISYQHQYCRPLSSTINTCLFPRVLGLSVNEFKISLNSRNLFVVEQK